MQLILDCADINIIRELYKNFPITGVTTNPTLLSRVKREPYEVLKEIREFIDDDELHAEALCTRAEDIVSEAVSIVKVLGSDTFVKVPVNQEGLKAIRELSRLKIRTTATAVFTTGQAFMAALCGASYVAPYVNRIEKAGQDGVKTALSIQEMLRANKFGTKVLAASFKRVDQVEPLMRGAVDAITLSPEMMVKLIENEGTDRAIESFISDFKTLGRDNMKL
ncbi:MAG: hypothetical protein K6G51_06280 [Sphaerochaetaceae bacterium]|nr:hypothetical protein [Sphaerochaetaceae bacterium]